MARIAGVNLPTGKHAEISLMYLYGVGRLLAQKILDKLKIERTRKIETFDETELDLIREELKQYTIEGDLRREVGQNIKLLPGNQLLPRNAPQKATSSSWTANQDERSNQKGEGSCNC